MLAALAVTGAQLIGVKFLKRTQQPTLKTNKQNNERFFNLSLCGCVALYERRCAVLTQSQFWESVLTTKVVG